MRWQDYLWLLLLSGTYLLIYTSSRKRRRRLKAPRRAGSPLTRREQKAWHALQAGGYRLEEIHPSIPVKMTVDGRNKSFTYEGNFIVSKGSESFLVKVIKGDSLLTWAGLRRELLLDCLFFQTDGVFFYHEEKGQLQEVRFAFQSEPGGGRERFLWKAALALLIIIGALFLGYLLWQRLF